MTAFEKIYDKANDNYGVLTSEGARECGVSRSDLTHMVSRGELSKYGQGVYKLEKFHNPSDRDIYAAAVALTGNDACLYGESVLAFLDLALVNPSEITVATPRRIRKALPGWVRIVKVPDALQSVNYLGVRSQPLADAIFECRSTVMTERLLDAVSSAERNGIILDAEAVALRHKLLTAQGH